MQIVIVSNIGNGVGLERDFCLLRDWLIARGHEAVGQQFDKPGSGAKYDLGIFLETINEHHIVLADRWWYFANPECLKPEFVRAIQRHCEKILVKTKDAERLMHEKFSGVHYVGFLTTDKRDAAVQREPRFLHVGGNSNHRNTNAVIAAWREYRYWNGLEASNAPLTVVSNSKIVDPCLNVPDITFIRRATDEQITELQNSHLFHILPSAYEGFGHALHESYSVGAILLTTGEPPMSELKAPFEIPSIRTKKTNLAALHEVSPAHIREAVPKMLDLHKDEIATMQAAARQRFEQGNQEFTELFEPHLSPPKIISVPKGSPLRIGIIGNFVPPHSTENDWVKSFSELGHTVSCFQENEDRTELILKSCIDTGVKLVLYVHTHSFSTPGDISVIELIRQFRAHKIKTASPHLDLYFGLNNGDGRQNQIGIHPFWKTDVCLTADGSSQIKFQERGVNHVWMKPGVLARECVPGNFRPEWAIDLGFCGAESYHQEWPWRGEMIRTLREVYGNRFRVFNGFRGQDLNDLYASVKILIADCCFAGKPRYISDRWPETCGRGGFLLAPYVEGNCIPVATFISQDIHDLMDKADYYLSHDKERDLIRRVCHEHVKAHDTYTHRAQQILEVCGL